MKFGLGYVLKVGPGRSTTLSGGEAQRVKAWAKGKLSNARRARRSIILDERPRAAFEDVRKLLQVLPTSWVRARGNSKA